MLSRTELYMTSTECLDAKEKEMELQKRSVFAKQADDIWTADLADMSPYSRSNSGYKYLLTVIDVFSKYGWIVPLKTKTGKEVAMAFQELFTDNAPLFACGRTRVRNSTISR